MRILIPLDGTPECEAAVPLARQLAGGVDGDIYLVRVVVWIDAFSGLRYDPDILRMMEGAAKYLDKVAARFELPPHRLRPLVRWCDNAAKEIIAVAQNEGIDLIVMTSHRKGWLRRLVQGSVYSEVVRSHVCPVTCVPLARAQAVRGRLRLLKAA